MQTVRKSINQLPELIMKDCTSENLGFGCVALTTFPFVNQGITLLETAFDNGIRFYDTAPGYGAGYSEKILGKFIKGKRAKVEVSTKFGLGNPNTKVPTHAALLLNYLKKSLPVKKRSNPAPYHPAKPSLLTQREIGVREIEQHLASSLDSLQTDYIDNYLLHEALPHFLTDDSLSFLLKKKSEGVIKNIGVATNYFNISQANNFQHWDILQYEYGPKNQHFKNLTELVPDKVHIYHSALKGLTFLKRQQLSTAELAGYILADCVKRNPGGKVLFSTTSLNNLKDNIRSFESAIKCGPETLQTVINYALS
jgi:aryl-alcohol dehydrogenase-like predicted oxidoreductase